MDLSPSALLGLLQWCDSFFPAGGYSQSFGLEEAVREGAVRNGEELFQWIRSRMIHSVLPGEGPIFHAAYEAALAGDLDAVSDWDARGLAIRVPWESREGSRAMGVRWIRMAAEVYPSEWTRTCREALTDGRLRGDPAVAFALGGAAAGRGLLPTFWGYLYVASAGQVSCGLRLLPVGQGEGQRMLSRLWPELVAPMQERGIARPSEAISSFSPGQEIRAMRHEIAETRLFQS